MWFCTVFLLRKSCAAICAGEPRRGQQSQDLEFAGGELQAALLVGAGRVVELADALAEVGGHSGAEHCAAAEHEVDGRVELLGLGVFGHRSPEPPRRWR